MKKVITSIIIVLCIGAGIWIGSIILSYKKVSFQLLGEGYSVRVHSNTGKELRTVDTSQDVRLQAGDYGYRTIGSEVRGDIVPFRVTSSGDTIVIKPRYTEGYLQNLAKSEQENILRTLVQQYPSAHNIAITRLALDEIAELAYGTLIIGADTANVYRFVMKRTDTSQPWKVAIVPSIIISRETAKANGIPEDILNSLYKPSNQ